MKWLKQKWLRLSIQERLLVVGVIGYLCLLAAYFSYSSSGWIRYTIFLLGIALAPLTPELVRHSEEHSNRKRNHVVLMVVLILLLAAGTTMVQHKDDLSNESERTHLKETVESINRRTQSLQLTKIRNDEVEDNKLHANNVRPNPLDIADGLSGAGAGFQKKADILECSVALTESRLMVHEPSLAERILRFPEDLDQRLAAYGHLKSTAVVCTNDASKELFDETLASLKEEAAYRQLTRTFKEKIVSRYMEIVSNRPDFSVARQKLRMIEDMLIPELLHHPLAGLYNHLGVLALGEEDKERAMGYFYSGLAMDRNHIPLYESVAYNEWAINHDSLTAMRYSSNGIELCETLPEVVAAEHEETLSNYAVIIRQHPDIKGEIDQRQSFVGRNFNSAKMSMQEYEKLLRPRLANLYAYTCALELQDQQAARRYAQLAYTSDTNDPDYQSTLGFVLMRFATNGDDLDQAESLFKTAEDNKSADIMTRDLVQLFRTELSDRRQFLSGDEVSTISITRH